MNTTTPDDPTDVRAAHDRVYRVSQIRTANAVIAVYGPFVGREHDYDDDRLTLSRAYLDLTDPRPLTVEVLVGMGFAKNEWGGFGFGKLTVRRMLDDPSLSFNLGSVSICPTPRTAGELAMILAMMEGR